MILSKWHRTRLKPTIQNFRGSLIGFSILDSSIVIYIWLVKINFCISIIIPVMHFDFCIFWKENFSLLCIVKITECLSCQTNGIRMRYKNQSLTFCLVIPIFQSIFYSWRILSNCFSINSYRFRWIFSIKEIARSYRCLIRKRKVIRQPPIYKNLLSKLKNHFIISSLKSLLKRSICKSCSVLFRNSIILIFSSSYLWFWKSWKQSWFDRLSSPLKWRENEDKFRFFCF